MLNKVQGYLGGTPYEKFNNLKQNADGTVTYEKEQGHKTISRNINPSTNVTSTYVGHDYQGKTEIMEVTRSGKFKTTPRGNIISEAPLKIQKKIKEMSKIDPAFTFYARTDEELQRRLDLISKTEPTYIAEFNPHPTPQNIELITALQKAKAEIKKGISIAVAAIIKENPDAVSEGKVHYVKKGGNDLIKAIDNRIVRSKWTRVL